MWTLKSDRSLVFPPMPSLEDAPDRCAVSHRHCFGAGPRFHYSVSGNLTNVTKPAVFAILALLPLVSFAAPQAASLAPARLRCEYRVDPLGIDVSRPRLEWIVQPVDPAARQLAQSAYEVLVSSSPDLLAKDQGDLWNSGKVASDETKQIAYGGQPLDSNQIVCWKVKVWDQDGVPSAWSPPAQWTMGLLKESDWSAAQWITAPQADQSFDPKHARTSYETVLLRREFKVKPNLRRALVHVCGLGQYELTIDGAKIGNDLLTPGWTLYNKTCLYDTYDITSSLSPGAHAAGIFLGNGFMDAHGGRYTKVTISFGPVQAIAVIRLEYADGSVENVITNDQWKTASGPITFSSIYGGEDYDARLVRDGWDKPGFDDVSWDKAGITDGPGGLLKGLSAAGPPIRTFDVLKPQSTTQLGPGVTIDDLGQNAAIMLRLRVKGPAGSSVRVIPSELLKKNGDINDTMCGGKSYWTYTLGGKGEEDYFSHFYYRGGRYLKVELYPASGGQELPAIVSIESDTLHADAPAVGTFSCSNPLYNKIYTLIRWAQMNNMVSVMTDCPTREKLGWLEEDHLNGPALRYNFDLAALLTKMVCDMGDSQRPIGMVTSTCPDYLRHPDNNRFVNPPEWGSACIIVPWQQYQFDADIDLLRRHYDVMKKYVAYLTSKSEANIVNFGLGDWYDDLGFGAAKLTPIALTATAFYYEDAKLLDRIAALLGKTDDAAKYRALARQILEAFNTKFFNASTDSYATGSQASNAVPLALDMVDPSLRAAVLDNLAKDLQAKQTTVGEVCLESLLTALADGGRSDLLYKTYSSESCGYGLQIILGKTCLTEGWNGGASQDHFMFGELNEWLFSHLAGIQGDPTAPGFKKIVIDPAVVGDLTDVRGSYDSIDGMILSQWKRAGSKFTLHVVIPANTTATVHIPAASASAVLEGDSPAGSAKGVKLLKTKSGEAIYEIGSGDYTFNSSMP
jgi:alpha-L-rhamnosidase